MIRDFFEEDVRDIRLAPETMLLGGFPRRFEAPTDGRPDLIDRVE
jgi:hypothetical protein